MIDTLLFLAEELGETFVQPRIDKAKVNFQLAIVTTLVVAIFALLALVCLFLVVFLHIADTMKPENAALILFAFSVLMCAGAVAAYIIGKRVEESVYERRREEDRLFTGKGLKLPDLHIGRRANEAFSDNKIPVLVGAAVIGMLFGVRPGMVIRTTSRLVFGKPRPRERDERERVRHHRRRR